MFLYALFMVPLFLVGAVLLTGLPIGLSLQDYYRNRGRQPVTCPDSGQRAEVEVDNKFAFRMALRGQQHSRLQTCSRWPEKEDCGQECLAELEPSPENIDRLLIKWYQGKSCAICARALTPADWRRSRLAVLNRQQKLFDLRQMQLDKLQAKLKDMRPMCWNCHQQERARHPVQVRIMKGDRHGLNVAEDSM